jgi:hypothetical protein
MIIHFAQYDVIPHWAGGFLSRLQRGRFAYALKNKAFHWAVSKWPSAPCQFAWANQWEYCYVSINHFETATATE